MATGNIGRLGLFAVAFALAACSGGGGANGRSTVTVGGTVTFDLVPTVAGGGVGGGLDYAGTLESPVRGATVELISGTTVLASATTDENGNYSLDAPADRNAFLRVKAELVRTGQPAWDFRVVDNTNGNALYALDGPAFNTGGTDTTQNLHAPSGWGGTGYTSERSAAPFAILDTVYEAAAAVVATDPGVSFEPLVLHWSVDNRPVASSTGDPDPATGEIVTSFYLPPSPAYSYDGIYLLGAEDTDTDEYDRHVILHEWGHYFEHALSRTDSVAGPHARNDELDMRTAFSEGWGNAFSAIASGDSLYTDAAGFRQSAGFSFDIEGPGALAGANQNPGWYSEESVQEILYDVVDANADGADALSLGFGALYEVLRGAHRTGVALTSIFTLVDALAAAHAAERPLIDALVADQSIEPVADAYGTGETNAGNPASPDVLPIYTPIAVGGGAVNVCSTDEFRSNTTGATNKLGSRRFLRFSIDSPGSYTFTATATDVPAGEIADPDLVLHSGGVVAKSDDSPTAICTANAIANCREELAIDLTPSDYVLEVYEWTNTQPDIPAKFAPIGLTCFDVEVTQ